MVGLTAVIGFLVGSWNPAWAADDPGDSVVAAVTGTTTPDTGGLPPLDPTNPVTRRGTFEDVVVSGTFVGVDGTNAAACTAVLNVGTVGFETTESLLLGDGTIDPATFSGDTTIDADNNCTVTNGTIADGTFTRAGTVAVFHLRVHYEVRECVNALCRHAEGRVRARGSVTVAIDPTSGEAHVAGAIAGTNPDPAP